MIEPYEFQNKMIDEARAAIATHRGVLIQSPTGSGKTVIGTKIMKSVCDKGRRGLFTVHRDFLIDQTLEAFEAVGLDVGVIAAGRTTRYDAPAQLASIDTLRHRVDKLPPIDLLISDECHHSPAGGWATVYRHLLNTGTRAVGLTATPWRLSGEGLSDFFSYMVRGPSVRWLIDNGYLSDYRAYAPSTPDMAAVHSRAGDYVSQEIESAMDKPTITGDAVNHYLRLAPGRRAVVFCCSIKHSMHVAAQFAASGVRSAHIDANTPREIRKAIIGAFRRGEIHVLCSVNIFGEGFDLPSVEVAILLRPTKSLTLHLQQIGRALRRHEGKERAIILDHAGNLLRLGLPDTEFEWTLDGRDKKKKDASPPIRQCQVCFFVYSPPVATCPACGHVHAVADRSPEEVAGELKEITAAMIAKIKFEQKREVFEAKTLDELRTVGKRRGYSPGWAANVHRSREAGAKARVESQAQHFLRGV